MSHAPGSPFSGRQSCSISCMAQASPSLHKETLFPFYLLCWLPCILLCVKLSVVTAAVTQDYSSKCPPCHCACDPTWRFLSHVSSAVPAAWPTGMGPLSAPSLRPATALASCRAWLPSVLRASCWTWSSLSTAKPSMRTRWSWRPAVTTLGKSALGTRVHTSAPSLC